MSSGEERQFLDGVYGLDDPEETKKLYRDWSASYETEIIDNGYATPARCAAALTEAGGDPLAPLLDLGCGTGLSGQAFREAGYRIIDGSDFSPEMLDLARKKAGLYRNLLISDLLHPLPGRAGDYPQIAAVGVFSPGHGPPELMDRVVDWLPPGGFFVFSLNDHTLEVPGYEERVSSLTAEGRCAVAFQEYGDHLPKRGIGAKVYVLSKHLR